jgi:Glyoxalase-like domain
MWLRLRQIALVAHELRPVVEDLAEVLAVQPCYVDPGVKVFGLENTLLPIGNQFIEVVAPTRPGTAGGRYLERRGGDGGYMVITQCDNHAPRRARVAELGVRIAWEMDVPGEYQCMQLHPRDTGATFFEIDEQLGHDAHNVDGPWHPAGPNWQRAKNTELSQGITAAELQVADPPATASRWAEIADLAVGSDSTGNPTLTLDNAELRFVAITDGRGEGLGGIDVAVTDVDQVVTLARARDRWDERGGWAAIGGMRIRPVPASDRG